MSVFPACVTPFDAQGRIDMPGIVRLMAFFRSAGCQGVVLAGTTGEGPSLSAVEKRDLVRDAMLHASGLEVILGIATPSLDEAVWLSRQASRAGASAALVMPPAYFREATEDGLYDWYARLGEASDLPILYYNFPMRSGYALTPELAVRLAGLPTVVGLKDSSGSRENFAPYRQAMPNGRLYVGDETLLLEAMDAGWTGTISGTANVLPEWLVGVLEDKDEVSRRAKFAFLLPGIIAMRGNRLAPLCKAMLVERGIIDSKAMRLPLYESDASAIAQTKDALAAFFKS